MDATVDGGEVAAVLRLSPPGARPSGPADMARQARIMSALSDAGAAVPRILASSAEPVLDGRPFVLMERVEGLGFVAARPDHDTLDLLRSAFSALRVVHSLPLARSGIGEEEPMPPRGEVERWRRLRTRAPEDVVAGAPRLEERLLSRVPAAATPVLVHGDYHLGNMLFRDGRVVAIVDWEIAELGQGPLDESSLCLLVLHPTFGATHLGEDHGLTPDTMLSLADPIPDVEWFLAATCHKYGAILAYNLGLHLRGKRHDPHYEDLAAGIPLFFETGLQLLS